jgi:acyl-coenzyme A synthetase/AMP-(fatty) acid ligase
MSFTQHLRHVTAKDPQRIALIDNGISISFELLDRSTHRLAAWMLHNGIVPGDRVGLTVRNEYRHLVAALALMRIGSAHVILATHDPMSVRAELAARCRLSCVIADQTHDAPTGVASLVPDFDRVFADAALDSGQLPNPLDQSVALLATSSGTTGRAKIVPVTERQLFDQTLAARWPHDKHTLFCPISVQFYAAQRQHLQTLCLGRTSAFWDRSRLPLMEACALYGVTVIALSASQARALVDEARGSSNEPLLPGVRFRLFGSLIGPALRKSMRESVSEKFDVIYGATECGMIAIAGPEAEPEGPGWLGRLQRDVSLEIVGDDGSLLERGESGNFRIRTPGMVNGYFDDDELTASTFRNGWFYPGDVGRLTRDGLLFLDGRADDVMNLSGVKVSSAEIQAVAETFPGVVECVAFPFKSPVHGDIPVLAVTTDGSADLGALLEFCRTRLGIRAPRRILKLDRLPRSAGGKVAYRELQAVMSADA